MHEAPKKSFGIFFLIGKIDKRWYDEIKFSCKEILLKFTINYSLFKLNYNLQQCSAISLTVVICCVSVPKECACVIKNSSAKLSGFLMPDQRHFPSLYSYFLGEICCATVHNKPCLGSQ